MGHSFQVVVDCARPHPLAEWWAGALHWQVEPTDEAFIRKLIDEGKATDAQTTIHAGKLVWNTGAAIVQPDAPAGSGCHRVLFQLVPEGKTVKNRVHLDVRVGEDQIDSEVERLVTAGATFLHTGQEGPYRWVTLADPEGNEFCIT